MIRLWRQHLLSFLFVLLLVSSIISLAQDAPYREAETLQSELRAEQQTGRDETNDRIGIRPRHSTKDTQTTVSPAVREALELLETLPSTSTITFSKNQPNGFIEHVYYYSKHLFRLLFMSEAPVKNPLQEPNSRSRLNPSLRKAITLLDEAALSEDQDAIYLLAEMNFYGNFTHSRNYRKAFKLYSDLAKLNGNSTAQYMLGLMYATGIGGSIERDQAKALLYHTTAAEQGNVKSEMTVAFRHHTGIGTPRNCDKAAYFYKRVADKAMAFWHSGPPGGASLPKDSLRWSDDKGGVFGEGASVVGTNKQQKNSAYSSVADAIEYLDFMSRDGDFKAVFTLGSLYYDGAKGLKRDVRKAHKMFMKVAKAYWGRDGKPVSNPPPGVEEFAGKSAARIGRMFLRGELMEQSYEKAATWFKRGVGVGNAFSQYQMGLLYRDGLGVPKDEFRAAAFFKAAADDDLAVAQSALAVLFLDQGDVETAVRYFDVAARHGNMEAFYYLAEIANKGVGGERHCGLATAYYKIVAEKAEIVHSSLAEANDAYDKGDLETAFINSVMAAEQGYENAQSNVAYILDTQRSMLSLRLLLPKENSRVAYHRNDSSLALIYWTRSAKQANIDSLIKMGDSYLSGSGTPRDIDKASTCYHTAADGSVGHRSAQALWNLGWMHENGISVDQDFHMAKRFYDLALELNGDAYLPVKLSLIKLRVRSYWNTLTHGSVNSIHDDADSNSDKRSWTLTEWIAHFLESADNPADDAADNSGFDELGLGPDTFHGDPMPGGDDNFDELDDSLLESLIIVGLAATLAFLVYYRNQRQLQMQLRRRQQQGHGHAGTQSHGNPRAQGQATASGAQAQQQQQPAPQTQTQHGNNHGDNDDDRDRGFFPQAGDPDFNNWVAGGIGH